MCNTFFLARFEKKTVVNFVELVMRTDVYYASLN